MNKERRARLGKAQELIDQAKGIIEDVAQDEREAFDNMPENMQQGERGQRMEEVCDSLDSLLDTLSEAYDTAGEAQD